MIIAAFLAFVVFSTKNKFQITSQIKSLLLIVSISILVLIPLNYNKTKEPVENKELQRVKDRIVGHLSLSLETSNQLANFFGGQEILTRKIITPEEIAKKIQAVTAEEIAAVSDDIFKNNKLNLAIIGPFEDKAKFEKILKL